MGCNQRAFVNFIRKDHARALVDLDQALGFSPSHLGALTGRAMTLIALGREQEAQLDFSMALGLNAWPVKRGLLKPEPSGTKDPDPDS